MDQNNSSQILTSNAKIKRLHTSKEIAFVKTLNLIKEIKENGEVELKVTRSEIIKKFEQALEIFIQDIPKKKEKPPFSLDEDNEEITKMIKRSSEKKITIEDQKNVILSLMLIEFDEANESCRHSSMLTTLRNHMTKFLPKEVTKVLEVSNYDVFN